LGASRFGFFFVFSLGMEVHCLGGKSLTVNPLEGLQEAKDKVAQVLGAFPEAIWISCAGQILSGSETLEICRAKLESDAPLFAVVDQKRMEMARHLRIFEPEVLACQTKMRENEHLSAKLAQQEKGLLIPSYRSSEGIELELLEGNMSLQQEKSLVAQLPKLKRREKLEDEFFRENHQLFALKGRLRVRISQVRDELETTLKNQECEIDEVLAEFDELARARLPQAFPDLDAISYYSSLDEVELEINWLDRYPEKDPPCPRLLRRETWNNSKKSWKYTPKTAPRQEDNLLDQAPGRLGRRKDGPRQTCCRRAIGREVKHQLEEYSSYRLLAQNAKN